MGTEVQLCRRWGRWCQAPGKKGILQACKKSQEGFSLQETRDMMTFAREKDSSGC